LMVLSGYSPLGSIRMFETYERAYREERQRRASSPQEELTQVAAETIEGYFRTHPPSAERAQRVRDLIPSENWPAKPERDLEVVWAFHVAHAEELLRVHKYSEAQSEAERALKERPGNMKALFVLSQAGLKQGDFAAASAALRQMLEQEPRSLNLTYQYAHALAGMPNHAQAARDFEDWVDSPQAGQDPLLPVATAGLRILAGDERTAKTFVAEANTRGLDTNDAARLGYLGWWYYLAARYDTASTLLTQATNMLPGNQQFVATLGWADIERKNYADALRCFRSPRSSSATLEGTAGTAYDPSTADAGLAVALWLSDQHSEAVSTFSATYDQRPEWRNPRWVRAMYSPAVWRAVSQIAAELERQRKERLRASGHPVAD